MLRWIRELRRCKTENQGKHVLNKMFHWDILRACHAEWLLLCHAWIFPKCAIQENFFGVIQNRFPIRYSEKILNHACKKFPFILLKSSHSVMQKCYHSVMQNLFLVTLSCRKIPILSCRKAHIQTCRKIPIPSWK